MKQTKSFNWGELLIPGITLLFGIAFIAQTIDGPINAMRWPYVIVAFTALFLVLVVWKFVLTRAKSDNNSDANNLTKNLSKELVILVTPVAYIFMMQYIGFAIASFLFLTLMFRLLGSRSWLATFAVAFLMTALLYVAMVILMQMPLPQLSIGTFTL